LAAAGVTFVAVHFDGYGDSGATEEVMCYDSEWYGWEEHQPVKYDAAHLQEHLEVLVPFGYENDCGGFGDVVLNVAEGKITVERNDRFEDNELRGVAMAQPLVHAQGSAKKFGGKPEDYLAIHNWFDESKALMPDFRHRALRHHSDGAFLAKRIFGVSIRNSDGLEVLVRYIAEQRIKEDLGRIPTVQDWLAEIRAQPWMYGQGAAMTAKLAYMEGSPYFSTLTNRYYSCYDAAFADSLRAGGGAEVDFNLLCHPSRRECRDRFLAGRGWKVPETDWSQVYCPALAPKFIIKG
jgi:hypothetical protein